MPRQMRRIWIPNNDFQAGGTISITILAMMLRRKILKLYVKIRNEIPGWEAKMHITEEKASRLRYQVFL